MTEDPARAGIGVALPFFARRMWVSWRPRAGAAPRIDFDPEALQLSPGVTWIGHATFLVRMDGATFLTDPMFSERASPLSFAGPPRLVPPGVPLEALPPVDFALVSHDHYDHADLPSLRALVAGGTRIVAPLGMADVVRAAGGHATELDWWEDIEIAGVRVHCVPAQHFSGRGLTDRNRRMWAGWVVEGPTRRFYHAGDTGLFLDMKLIAEMNGPLAAALIPIGDNFTMGIDDAVKAAEFLGAGVTIPMHYDTFDWIKTDAASFVRKVEAKGLKAAVVKPGETYTIK